MLMDGRTGALLYEKNAFSQMDPASTTKIMTALLVIEHGDLNQEVTVSRRADATSGSSLHIGERQRYSRLDLLRGMLLRSGNDASVALAESEAGSVERFVAEMNIRAQQLGAFNTAYENTHGLTQSGHYSSAYDLALIARTALKQPLFQEIVKSQQQTITELSGQSTRTISSTNQLLYGFPGADGVKTGTTTAAGRCVVASATRDNRQLIAVILKSGNRWGDASELLNWGFLQWQGVEVAAPGHAILHVPVRGGRRSTVGLSVHSPFWVDVRQNASFSTLVKAPASLKAPLSTGNRVGFISVVGSGLPPQRRGLYPDNAVRAKPIPLRIWHWILPWRH